jgi:hypothetical protein
MGWPFGFDANEDGMITKDEYVTGAEDFWTWEESCDDDGNCWGPGISWDDRNNGTDTIEAREMSNDQEAFDLAVQVYNEHSVVAANGTA